MQLPTTTTHETDLPLGGHETDLPLGGQVRHGNAVVKIFGRERDNKTGIVKSYWVLSDTGKRYQVEAKKLTI